MAYRRRARRSSFKRRYVAKICRQVMQYAGETKVAHYNIISTQATSTAAFLCGTSPAVATPLVTGALVQIDRGSGDYQRVGNEINVIRIRLRIRAIVADAYNDFRIVLLRSAHPLSAAYGATPPAGYETLSNMYFQGLAASAYDPPWLQYPIRPTTRTNTGVKILKQKQFRLHGYTLGTVPVSAVEIGYKDMSFNFTRLGTMSYLASTVSGADYVGGHLYLMIQSDSDLINPTVVGHYEVWYKDA